ncbi:MAG: helix-hairpin-helix domain-containing protein [Ruminococcus flavefaciens]|nr:helix-hairpin-helix domain-containing protein [Ruminococcus flavefaciens]
MDKQTDLRTIPNVGEKTKQAFINIGINSVEDLKGKDPTELYFQDCLMKGFQEDKCQLYLFRMAVYYAENTEHQPEKLKWWYWKDKEYPEVERDGQI